MLISELNVSHVFVSTWFVVLLGVYHWFIPSPVISLLDGRVFLLCASAPANALLHIHPDRLLLLLLSEQLEVGQRHTIEIQYTVEKDSTMCLSASKRKMKCKNWSELWNDVTLKNNSILLLLCINIDNILSSWCKDHHSAFSRGSHFELKCIYKVYLFPFPNIVSAP